MLVYIMIQAKLEHQATFKERRREPTFIEYSETGPIASGVTGVPAILITDSLVRYLGTAADTVHPTDAAT